MLYALPKMILKDNQPVSTYVPLNQRAVETSDEITIETDISETEVSNIEEATQQEPNLEIDEADALNVQNPSLSDNQEGNNTPVVEEIEIDLKDVVESAIQSWSTAWSSQNVDAYLSHYASSFISERGQNLEQWKAYRSSRVTAPNWIDISLLRMEIAIDSATMATARFEQIYSASNYSDQSRKELRLVLEDGQWKIDRELSLD